MKQHTVHTVVIIIVFALCVAGVIFWPRLHVRTASEAFATGSASACPASSTWFVGADGVARCCNGQVSSQRNCLGQTVCTFSPGDNTAPQCGAVLAKQMATVQAKSCPLSTPYLITAGGSLEKPVGCCAASTGANGSCPVSAAKCTLIAPGGNQYVFGPAGKGQKMECLEQKYHENLTCPAGGAYTKSQPIWSDQMGQNVTTCLHARTMSVCYPSVEFKTLGSRGKLGANNATNSVLECSIHKAFYEDHTLTAKQVLMPQ